MRCDICGSENSYIRDCKYTISIKNKEVTIICQKRFCNDCNNEIIDEKLEKETLKKAEKKYTELYGINKNKVLELRKSYNLSQELFSKIIGCAKKTLVSYEKGTSTPNDNYANLFNILMYKPKIILDLIEANKDMYTKKEYDTIMKKIRFEKKEEPVKKTETASAAKAKNTNARIKVRVQKPEVRVNNFEEVEFGLTYAEALNESNRCLQCKNPRCMKGCPVSIRIPEFIACIKQGNIKKAYEIISESSNLPAICGRVCPQEKQCESMCVQGLKGEAIAIGALERYVADYAIQNHLKIGNAREKNGKTVAIVGSGPAGLTCAGDLAKAGFDVTIYEVLHKAGGVLTYGIPEFRLPKLIVESQVESLKELGVKIVTDTPIGNAISLADLRKRFDYVFISSGAGLPKFMGIKGESANEVFSANEILTRINLMKSYQPGSKTPIKKARKAFVIGGGNVAMDAVRSLKRLGIDAHLMYRRSMEELPARKVEVEHALEEGVKFDLLQTPVEILTNENNSVIGINVVNMKLGEVGEDGRRSVTENPKSLHMVKCDMIVMALGTSPNHEALKNSQIVLTDRGLIQVEGTKTSLKNVYAGGDAVTGSATVILAMEAGKNAAKEIMAHAKVKNL